MIPEEERTGLLCEADHAEKTGADGGYVRLSPAYTRYLMETIADVKAAICCDRYSLGHGMKVHICTRPKGHDGEHGGQAATW